MSPFAPSRSRRRFLSDLAVLGLTPLWGRPEALAWFQAPPGFTGDDLEQAHRLLFDPARILAGATPIAHADPYDVIVIGAGIAGLTVADALSHRRVLVLERELEAGGVAKSETWNGLEYALGAAYIIDPDPESEDERERRGFMLLESLGLRSRDEDLGSDRTRGRRLSGGGNHCLFTNTRTLSESSVYSAQTLRFFEHVLDSDEYPSVPPTDPSLVDALDRLSFAQFLRSPAVQRQVYGRTCGPLSDYAWEAIEYYCWGAFGTSASETSAYHGLNFFAAEFADILVFPGGNAAIAKRLAQRIVGRQSDTLRTGHWVLRVDREDQQFGVYAYADGRVHRFGAKAVVYASPLFLAPRIISWLPDAQQQAIASLQYRAYVVGNVLLRRSIDQVFGNPALRNGYELTRLQGANVRRDEASRISARNVYSDVVVADFPVWRHRDGAVLTVYRPFPYDGGRAQIMGSTFGEMEAEIRGSVLDGFSRHGLRSQDIEAIRLSRWGHPMLVTRPGQLADGTMARASQAHGGLVFAHTDTQGAPAYENALASAFAAIDTIEAQLKS